MRDGAPFNIPRNVITTLPIGCTRMLADHFSRLDNDWEYGFHIRDTRGRDWVVNVSPAGPEDRP